MKKYCILLMLFFIPLSGIANPPPAKEVFQISTRQVDPNTFVLDWQIKKGFFLYKKRISLTENPNNNFHLGALRFPDAEKYKDARGKTYSVYRDHVTLPVSILGTNPGEALLDVHYQGCSDGGFCYPPQTNQIKLAIDSNLALSNVAIEESVEAPQAEQTFLSESDKLDLLFSAHSWIIIILSFFGFGLLLSFTPCVLPMVPVLSGIIVGHGENISTRKAFFLSLSYVLSMSVTYAIVGAIVALMGNNLQIAMQSPWAISVFSLIFVFLALSMFNIYELRLPLSWQAKLAHVTQSQSSGHYLSAAIMGCLSTLIISPCVTAPLIGALGYIAQSGNVILGSISLFFLSLGMGTPLLLIGTSAGKLLPRAGRWMNVVKAFFGVMLLGVAVYLMSRVLPSILIMGLWASLLIFSGIYLGALSKAKSHGDKFCQGLGIILLVYGILVLIGASQGNSNPLHPLEPTHNKQYLENKPPMVIVKTVSEAVQAIANAKGKPVVVDFYADWCTSCKVIASTTLQDPRVLTALKSFVVIKVDLSANDVESKALLKLFDVVAPPTFLFYDAEGKELNDLRLVGEMSATTFYTHLDRTLSS